MCVGVYVACRDACLNINAITYGLIDELLLGFEGVALTGGGVKTVLVVGMFVCALVLVLTR